MRETRARRLRANPTDAEKAMWRLLYPFRTGGYHFRKQAPIGPFVVDFVCHAEKLVIEIDGGQHFTDPGMARDADRTGFLRAHGYREVRFTNLEVLGNAPGVFSVVKAALNAESKESS